MLSHIGNYIGKVARQSRIFTRAEFDEIKRVEILRDTTVKEAVDLSRNAASMVPVTGNHACKR